MRRVRAVVPVLVLVFAGWLGAVFVDRGVSAQEGTPTAAGTPEGSAAGVTVEVLGAAPPAPGQVQTLLRLTFEPGAALPLHANPGATIAFVESGALALTAVTGVAEVTRVLDPGDPAGLPPATPGPGTPPPATPTLETEAVVVGAEADLVAGESLAFGPDLIHGFRNDGDEPAVLLLTGLYDDDAVPFLFVEEPAGGTPTAATPSP